MSEIAVDAPFEIATELEVVTALVARQLDLPLATVAPSARLKHDLGLGLLGLAVLALEVEDVTGVLVPFDAITGAQTVEAFARALHTHRLQAHARGC